LVNDDVAFEIRHRVESTIVLREEFSYHHSQKARRLSREVEHRWSAISVPHVTEDRVKEASEVQASDRVDLKESAVVTGDIAT
jgi:hypothetical protein